MAATLFVIDAGSAMSEPTVPPPSKPADQLSKNSRGLESGWAGLYKSYNAKKHLSKNKLLNVIAASSRFVVLFSSGRYTRFSPNKCILT
jgi:hypothetical protein